MVLYQTLKLLYIKGDNQQCKKPTYGIGETHIWQEQQKNQITGF
jgi:hypothetical protein